MIEDAVNVNREAAIDVVGDEMDATSTAARLGFASHGQGRRRLIEIAVFGALIVGALFTLPGLGELRDRLAGADAGLIALVAAVEVGSCLAFVAAFRGVFSRRLGWRFSYEVAMSEQAANVLLPTGGAGGLALGAWALRRVGMPAERIGRRTVAFFLVTSSINFIAVIVAGVGLALGVLPGDAAIGVALIPAVRRGAGPRDDRLPAPRSRRQPPRGWWWPDPRRARIRARAPRRRHPRRDLAARLGRPLGDPERSATWASTWSRWRWRSPLSAVARRRPAPSCSPTRSASSAASSRSPAASAAPTAD